MPIFPLEAVTNLLYLAQSTTDRGALSSLLAQADEELKRVALRKQTDPRFLSGTEWREAAAAWEHY